MIYEFSDMEVFKISDRISIRDIKRWMAEHELTLGSDWAFYGFYNESSFALGIKDKSKAMLFKLTWIG